MAHRILKPKSHDEWLKYRTAGIGSSDVGTIIGVNPYETPYGLWAIRKGLKPKKEENFLMRAGHYLEDAVSRFFADKTHADIVKSSAGDWMVVDTEHEWRRVSPDRFYWAEGDKHNQANKRILECKTTQHTIELIQYIDEDGNIRERYNVPRYWYSQLQYQLGVCELQNGALAWLTQGREFAYQEEKFNAHLFEWMMQEVDEFYHRYIIGSEEPPLSNFTDVLTKFPNSLAGKSVDVRGEITLKNENDELVTYDIQEVCAKLREANATISKFDKIKEHYQGVLKTYMGDAEILTDDSRNIASWKNNKPTFKIDSKRLQAERPDIFAEYSNEVAGSRVFRFK